VNSTRTLFCCEAISCGLRTCIPRLACDSSCSTLCSVGSTICVPPSSNTTLERTTTAAFRIFDAHKCIREPIHMQHLVPFPAKDAHARSTTFDSQPPLASRRHNGVAVFPVLIASGLQFPESRVSKKVAASPDVCVNTLAALD